MRCALSVVLALVVSVCAAEGTASVYRSTGAQGETVYSDDPSPGAERIEVVIPTGIPAPRASAPATGTSAGDDAAPYERFAIAEPEGGATIRANSGNVPVVLEVRPSLRAGDRIRIDLDGETREVHATSTLLTNVPRGAHRLGAAIVGENGEVRAAAGPVEFQLLRISRLTKPSGPSVPRGAGATSPPLPGGPGPPPTPNVPGGAVRR